MSAGAGVPRFAARVATAVVAALLCIVPVGDTQSRAIERVDPSAGANTAAPRAEILWSFDSGG